MAARPHPGAARKHYDVVIVGAGVVGAMMAKELCQAGKSVLLLEAGRTTSIRPEGYASYVETFQTALAKTPNSPYPQNPNAPQSSVLFQTQIKNGPVTSGYQVYEGPLPFFSTYTRSLGGTTLHFLGTCIRMVPHDFELKSRYGRAIDWPFGYDHLEPYYEAAELEMGVAADVEEQRNGEGSPFRKGYEFPMRKIPPSYLDRWLKQHLRGLKQKMGPEMLDVKVVSPPAGRNGMPNPDYIDPRTKKPYRPKGAVYDPRTGQRCEGNSACVPICPVMAKYNALRTLYSISEDGASKLEIVTQAIASRILYDDEGKNVVGIRCKLYDNENVPTFDEFTATAERYVIAAHAIETAKLLLASNRAREADGKQACVGGPIGKYLMDHPYMLTWGQAPPGTHLGVFRGPQITSEIPMRDGAFRKDFSAFRADIRNNGWDFSTGAPYSDLAQLLAGEASQCKPDPPAEPPDPSIGIDALREKLRRAAEATAQKGYWGKKLRSLLQADVGRQISFGFQVEQLPCDRNQVRIDDAYIDPIGNYRPVLRYDVSPYEKRSMKTARELTGKVMDKIGGTDCTHYDEHEAGYLGDFEGVELAIHGAGHIMGTHRMGTHPDASVVDRDQRVHGLRNLFLVGCGNMPTIGSSNPTLTVAALAYKAVERLKKDLDESR